MNNNLSMIAAATQVASYSKEDIITMSEKAGEFRKQLDEVYKDLNLDFDSAQKDITELMTQFNLGSTAGFAAGLKISAELALLIGGVALAIKFIKNMKNKKNES